MENKVKRELPDNLMEKMDLKPFETTEIGHPVVQRVAPKVRVTTGQNKIADSLDSVIKDNLKDGMTISFHHHFRNGDYIFNM
ncbi:citrate lyase subunit alpha, partial [Lactobacillus acidophilus]